MAVDMLSIIYNIINKIERTIIYGCNRLKKGAAWSYRRSVGCRKAAPGVQDGATYVDSSVSGALGLKSSGVCCGVAARPES